MTEGAFYSAYSNYVYFLNTTVPITDWTSDTITIMAVYDPSDDFSKDFHFHNCSGDGQYFDVPFWGACDDCTTNPVESSNACEPCGQAYARCDDGTFNTDWNTHKCEGSSQTCLPGTKVCNPIEGGTNSDVYQCGSSGCAGVFLEDCGYHYWTDQYRCVGNVVQRLYSENGCKVVNSVAECYTFPNWIDQVDCSITGSTCVSGACINAPNVPVLVAPPNNTCVNSNPTFQATVSDPDNRKVRGYFQILGFGNVYSPESSYVNSGSTVSYGPVNLGTCAINSWRAYAQNESGVTGNPSAWWTYKIDKTAPETISISYASGTINTTSVPVTLTESDSCTGITEGDVDIKIKPNNGGWGGWVNTGLPSGGSTISDFTYTGTNGYSYQFRYRVKDGCNNWSAYVEGPTVSIDLNDPPTCTNLDVDLSNQCIDVPYYSFSCRYSDPDNDRESGFVFQIDNNSNFSSPEINRTIPVNYPSPSFNNQTVTLATIPTSGYLSFNTGYYWRIMVTDVNSLSSAWINGSFFNTPVRHCPIADFTNIPTRPNVNESVQFTDASKCFNLDPQYGNVCPSFSWTFTGGTPPTSALQNPITKFTTIGDHDVTLQVSDGSCSCSEDKTLNANYPPPTWKEILPF